MKKLLSGALALMLGVTCVGALAGCDGNNETDNNDQEALQAAMSGIKAMYVDKYVDASTPNDYELVGQYPVNGTYCPITWTVNVTEGVSVKAMDETSKTVTIDVNEKTPTAVEYELTASLTYNGLTETYTFKNLKVPAYVVNSYADYISAKKGDKLRVTGTVTGFAKKGDGATANTIFMQDTDGGYYVYSLASATLPEGLAIGKTLTVTGEYDFYNGLHELKSATVESMEDGTAVAPKDITDLVKAAENSKDKAIVALQSQLVTIKGATVYDVSATNNTYYGFKLGNVESYVRISTSDCPTGADNQEAIKTAHAANYGKTATVTGLVTVYGDAFYIVPVGADAFKDFAESTATADEKIAMEKTVASLPTKITESGDVELPTPKTYQDVTFSWTSNNAAIVIADDNSKMTVTVGDTKAEVKVTLTISCTGGTTDTKEFNIVLRKPTVSTGEFKLGLYQKKLEKKLYFTGEMSGYYYGTTENIAEAATVVVAAVEGGYTLKVGEKFLELQVSGTYLNVKINDTSNGGVWKYDHNIGVFTWTIAEGEKAGTYYLGTSGTFNTLSANDIAKISGANASTIGNTNFVAYLRRFAEEGNFKLALQQENLNKKLYFTGEMKGYYYGTTEKIADAATVVVAAVEGGYTLKVGEKFLELEVSGTHLNVKINETSNGGVWKFDNDLGVFTWTIAEGEKAGTYYLGTSGTYNTLSANDVAKISGDKASTVGDTNFVAWFEKVTEE